MLGIARKLAWKQLRVRRNWSDLDEERFAPAALAPGNIERVAVVAQAVGLLPPLQREAIILAEYEGLSLEEMALAAHCELAAVKSRLHRARENLRALLRPLLDEEKGGRVKPEDEDARLRALLIEWQVPDAPPSLDARLQQRQRPAGAMALAAALAIIGGVYWLRRPSPPPRAAAPEFTLPAESGSPVRLSDYRGRVVVLNFWATWCEGCKTEIPAFVNSQRRFAGSGLQVVGVSMDEAGWRAVGRYLAGRPVNYPVLLGDAAVAARYHVRTLPVTVCIDRRGSIAARYDGVIDAARLERDLAALLAEDPQSP